MKSLSEIINECKELAFDLNFEYAKKWKQEKEAYVIQPTEWGNIWVYGLEIFLAGYLSYEDFGQRAVALAPNSKVFQYEHTRVKNLSLPVSSLKPMKKLF